MTCEDCQRPMVTRSVPVAPEGHARYASRGRCTRCIARARRAGRVHELPVRRQTVDWEARIEDLEWMLQYDTNAEQIAHRAGFTSAATAVTALRRRGRADLAAQLYRYSANGDPYISEARYADRQEATA